MFYVYADDKLLYSPRLLNEGYAIGEPQVTLELNKAGCFTFNLPSTNPLYSSLKKLKTIITVHDDDNVIWKGRVLNDTKDFYNTKAVTCEGELAFLNDIQYEPHDYSKNGIKMGEYFKKLVEYYASECSPERMIKLGRVSGAFTDVLIYPKTTDYTNIWNLISGNLIGASTGKVGKDEVDLSDYDRYLYIRRQNGESLLEFVEDIGKGSGQVIEFGKNLLDLSEYVNASNVYTQIIPLGKADSKGNRVDIKLVNNGKNYLQSDSAMALFGKIQKAVTWDDVTNRNTLKANGERMLNKAIEMAIKITIRAFDLHQIDVDTDNIEFGDKVHVVSLPHEISSDFLCSKIVFVLDNPENTEYTFGLDFESMTGNLASYKRTYQYKMASVMDTGNQNTLDLADTIARLDDLKIQVDGNICSWFYPGVPTSTNFPASEWKTEELKQQHLGDLYYNKNTGVGYRWTVSGSSYNWETIKDVEVNKALEAASKAQASADGKIRCFTSTPVPPYDIGDLWVQGSSGDIMRCKVARASGSYTASDWTKASKYTDDTVAIEAGKTATDYIKDGTNGIQVGPKGNSNVTMTDEGLIFHGIRNQESIYEFGSANSYAECTISLDLSKYSAVLLTFESNKGSTWFAGGGGAGCISTVLPVNGQTYSLVYPWNTPHRRDVKVSPNGITFGPGKERTSTYGGMSVAGIWGFDLQTPGGDGWTQNDSVCMPRQLFGFM